MKTKFNPANWLESTRLAQWVLSQHSELDAENFLMWLGSVSYLSPDKCHAVLEHLDMVNLFGDGPVLHLPIKGVWFNMIASGVKKEEYRDVTQHYASRLCDYWGLDGYDGADDFIPRHYDLLHLTNGYGHDKPQLWADIESITIGPGNPAWGAEPGVDYFVIKIGKILHTNNLK